MQLSTTRFSGSTYTLGDFPNTKIVTYATMDKLTALFDQCHRTFGSPATALTPKSMNCRWTYSIVNFSFLAVDFRFMNESDLALFMLYASEQHESSN